MVLMGYSGARGTLIYEKNLMSKISCQTPFKLKKTVKDAKNNQCEHPLRTRKYRFENAVYQEVAKTRRKHNDTPRQQEHRLRESLFFKVKWSGPPTMVGGSDPRLHIFLLFYFVTGYCAYIQE
jgi:hypothetical protein